MTLPVSGPMQASMVNVELRRADTNTLTMNETPVRTLAAKPTGIISLNDFYGKTNRVPVTITISANTTNYILDPINIPEYIMGKTDVTIVVNSGIYLYSILVDSPALSIKGWNTGDTVTIINNGYIIGMGGSGYKFGGGTAGSVGSYGGNAISIYPQMTIFITNNSYIAGGGGSGGGNIAGGGAGGGNGSDGLSLNSGGLGGGPGLAGSNGVTQGGGSPTFPAYIRLGTGGGGGRILPGVGGAGGVSNISADMVGKGGGAGGGAGWWVRPNIPAGGGSAGAGGSANNPGVNTSGTGAGSGGGGGWGSSGGIGGIISSTPYAGGIGGKAIDLQGSTVVLTVPGTIYGAVS